ncbi:MAG: translation initiation factor Sui1 [Verrucomicrobiales bacterium]|nr:translation initiation factor Sui1 [Verrucomicrobiales bacterium]
MARQERVQFTDESIEFNNPFANLEIDRLPLGEPDKQQPLEAAEQSRAEAIFSAGLKLGRVVLRRETAHRGGKVVVVIDQFAPNISAKQIQALAKKLRSACGCGGTTKERSIELQGNHVEKIRQLLEQEGFRVAGVR